MVTEASYVSFAQLSRHNLTVPPGQAVNDAREAQERLVDESNDVLSHFLRFLGHHNVFQVDPVEALGEPNNC